MSEPAMTTTFDSLAVPADFSRHDKITDATVLASLDAWKSNTESLLHRLDSLDVPELSISELADLVCTLAPLTAVAQWTLPTTRSLASGTSFCLERHVRTNICHSSSCQDSCRGQYHHPHPHPGHQTSLRSNSSSKSSHAHCTSSVSSSRCTGCLYRTTMERTPGPR